MTLAIVTGGIAGIGMGFVLQRGQLCFHSAISDAYSGRFLLVRAWALGVAIASVGLAVIYLLPDAIVPGASALNRGLPFTPVANIVGGLIIGVGMSIARSCVSGLFYKLGAGMLGAVVGIAGWAVGEFLARKIVLPGPTILGGGPSATLPGVLGLPTVLVASIVLIIVALVLVVTRGRRPAPPRHRWQWGWPKLGVGLGLVTIAGWVLAALGGSSFGPSTVGAVNSIAAGAPNVWLIAFLLGIVPGGTLAARTAGGFEIRGERPIRYVRLAVGGVFLGAGGWIAGGCNLGHGVSGMAQLNVSSAVVVLSMVAGVGALRWTQPK